MAVTTSDIRLFIQDFASVTGRNCPVFVCPITLKECELPELINGHILNAAYFDADRRTIVQLRSIDNFYGAHAEPEAIRFLNLRNKSEFDVLSEATKLRVIFQDKSEASAFAPTPKAIRQIGIRFPILDFPTPKGIVKICIKVPVDDERLSQVKEVKADVSYYVFAWIATMVKAAFLCAFQMYGYRAVFDPLGDTVRRSLAGYYHDGHSHDNARRHFCDFLGSVKIIGHAQNFEQFQTDYSPIEFDTLRDREFLLHTNEGGRMFAMTSVFRINGLTTAITLPQSDSKIDAAVAFCLYREMLTNKGSVRCKHFRARLEGANVEYHPEPINVSFL